MKTFIVCDDNQATLCDFEEVAVGQNSGKVVTFSSKESVLDHVENFNHDIDNAVYIIDLQLASEPSAGFDILRAIRSSPILAKVPVVIVTTASEQETVNESYELGANAFVRKKDAPQEFRDDIAAMYSFWNETSPHRGKGA